MKLVVGAQLGSPQMVQLICHVLLKEYSRARAHADFIFNLSRNGTMYLEKVMNLRKSVRTDIKQRQISVC